MPSFCCFSEFKCCCIWLIYPTIGRAKREDRDSEPHPRPRHPIPTPPVATALIRADSTPDPSEPCPNPRSLGPSIPRPTASAWPRGWRGHWSDRNPGTHPREPPTHRSRTEPGSTDRKKNFEHFQRHESIVPDRRRSPVVPLPIGFPSGPPIGQRHRHECPWWTIPMGVDHGSRGIDRCHRRGFRHGARHRATSVPAKRTWQ